MEILPAYIGYDRREQEAVDVCIHSLKRHSSIPIFTMELRDEILRYINLYDRKFTIREGVMYDDIDEKPFSTEFAFTRFLVPALAQYTGWALFCDCDMLFRSDIAELLELRDDKYAVMCVPHDHRPRESRKMDGQIQQKYRRKNWSSFVLWNCGHPANKFLTVDAVNRERGSYLHQFEWLKDDQIGHLPEEYNWLEGSSSPAINPKVVHFTRGGPWMMGYEETHYADEWRKEYDLVQFEKNGMTPTQVERFTGGHIAAKRA